AQIASVTTGTSYNDSGLSASTTYQYQVAAFDKSSPTPVVSAKSSALNASTDTGGPGIGGYYVYRNGAQIASVTTGTSYNDAGLSPSTTYQYQVAAFDRTAPPSVSPLSAALPVT